MLYLFILLQSFLINNNPNTWQTNFDKAVKIATVEDKNILMIFSGSDWCAPCKKLKKKILINSDFQTFEKNNLVILYLDFPSKKKNKLTESETKHNEALADKYNRSGSFPYIVLLDKSGEKIKTLKYKGQSVEKFIFLLK